MTHGWLEVRGDPGNTVEIVQDEEYERRQAENDKCKLDHFVVHRGGEAAQRDVEEDYGGCGQRGLCEAPTEKGAQYLRERVEANARNENHHDAATDNIQGSSSFVEPQFKEFRYGQCTAPHVDRHHAEGEEEHGGYSADPIKMQGFSTILRTGGDDSDNLERSTVGSEKSDCGHHGGQRASRMEELGG